jgi:hypothetical protein
VSEWRKVKRFLFRNTGSQANWGVIWSREEEKTMQIFEG